MLRWDWLGRNWSNKTARHGGNLTVADRWFASSQIHHGCATPDGTPSRLIGKGRIDKHLVCPLTGEVVDRDINAARNLRDGPDHAAQLGTRPHRFPGQPQRWLVQAMASAPQHPAPTELL